MADIRMVAVLTAAISIFYSIICMGIEFTNVMDHSVNVGIVMTWFIIYLTNTLINIGIVGMDTLKKDRLIFWFGFTLFLLIIRLACTNYTHLSIRVLFTIIVNIYMLFVLETILLLIKKMDNSTTTDIRSSLTSVAVNNEIISVTADETNIEDLSDNLRSAIHNGGCVIGSSSSNLNNDCQIVFGTAPTLDDINNDFTELNNHSYNLARSADINMTANANDPPPSYDDVMTPKNEKL